MTLTALTIAATVVTAGGEIYQGIQAKKQGQVESQVAERNAKLEEASRADAMDRRNIDQMRLWRRVTQQLGEQRANAAASGLDVNFGSPAEINMDTLQIGEEDSNTLNQNYIKEFKGYDINASNYRVQGAAALSRGNSAFTGSLLSAGGTLLSGASQVGKINLGPSPSASSGSYGGGGP